MVKNLMTVTSTFAKILAWIIMAAAAVCGLLVVCQIFLPLLGSSCGDSMLRSVESPHKLRLANLYRRNCGATTNFSTIITVGKVGQPLDPNNDENVVFFIDGSPDVDIRWKSDRLLVIKIPIKDSLNGKIIKKILYRDDIQIIYAYTE